MTSRFLIGVLGAAAIFLSACNQAPAQPASAGQRPAGGQVGGGRTIAVTVAPVTKGVIQAVLTYSGSIQPKAQVNVVPKTTGRIEKLLVDVGGSVKAGDPIAQIEQASAQVSVQQAEASLASAKAKLAAMKAGSRAEDIASAEANVRSAQAKVDQLTPTDSDMAAAQAALAAAKAQLSKAQNDLATLKAGPDPDAVRQAQLDVEQKKASLNSANITRDGLCARPSYQCQAANATVGAAIVTLEQSQAKLDSLLAGPKPNDVANAEKNAESAKASVASAQSKVDQIVAGPKSPDLAGAMASLDQAKNQLAIKQTPFTTDDLKGAEAAVAQAQASLDNAKLTLADTTVLAPFDGIIASRALSVGALATAQSPIASLISKDVELLVNVEEGRIAQLRPGLAVAITVPAYPGVSFSGTVSAIMPVADSKSHTFSVKIGADNSSSKLIAGMFGEVKITADRHDNALLVPRDSVTRQGDQLTLFIAKDGQAVRKTVQTGISDDKVMEILDGVSADDQVIVSGQNGLNNGDRIIIPAQAGAGQSGTSGQSPGGRQGGQGAPQGGQGAQPTGQAGQPAGARGGQSGYPAKPGATPAPATPAAGNGQ